MTKKDIEIFAKDGNICVSVGKKIVFSKPKTEQTVSIANDIYMYHKYKDDAKKQKIIYGER